MTYVTFVPGQEEVVTANPENIKHILKDNFQNYPKGPHFQENFVDLLGHGIFNSDGEQWRAQRKAASLAFSTNSMRHHMMGIIQDELHGRLIPRLDEAAERGQPVDIEDLLLRYTFDNICRIGFGVDPGCLAPGLPCVPFAQAFDQATQVIMLRNILPTAVWKTMRLLGVGPESRLRRCIKAIKEFVTNVIDRRVQEMREEPMKERTDILSRMMSLGAPDDVRNSRKFLVDTCVNFVLAGRDTSAIALTWLFWNLSQHREAEERILEEVQGIVRGRGHGQADEACTFDELRSMTYVQAAINESLRLHPSVPVGSKYAVDDDVLPDGTFVRKGSRVLYVSYATGRMKPVWGEDASDFKPMRWLSPEGCLKNESAYKFPAFNAGPRLCLGKDLAYIQMKSAISSILSKFSLKAQDHVPAYQVSLTLFIKGGLYLVPILRK